MGISNTIPPSRLIQPGVVANTAARPTSPFTGQAIYQVDTNQYLIWNGTAWVIPNSPAQNPTGLEFISTTTWTSATSVTVDNVFTTTYTNYLVLCNLSSNTNNQETYLRFRSGGVTQSGATDYAEVVDQRYTTVQSLSGSNGRTELTLGGVSSGLDTTYRIDVFQPVSASTASAISSTGANIQSGYTMDLRRSHGFRRAASAHDGFFIGTLTSATIAGTITVYGYRKA